MKETEVMVESTVDDEEGSLKILQEAAIIGQFCHANIIKLYGIIHTPYEVHVISASYNLT